MTDEQAILTPERVATVAAILHPNGPGATVGEPPPILKAELTQAREPLKETATPVPCHVCSALIFVRLNGTIVAHYDADGNRCNASETIFKPTRKRRSDAGVKKGPKTEPEGVRLDLTVTRDAADAIARWLMDVYLYEDAARVLECMSRARKRIDALERQKEANLG